MFAIATTTVPRPPEGEGTSPPPATGRMRSGTGAPESRAASRPSKTFAARPGGSRARVGLRRGWRRRRGAAGVDEGEAKRLGRDEEVVHEEAKPIGAAASAAAPLSRRGPTRGQASQSAWGDGPGADVERDDSRPPLDGVGVGREERRLGTGRGEQAESPCGRERVLCPHRRVGNDGGGRDRRRPRVVRPSGGANARTAPASRRRPAPRGQGDRGGEAGRKRARRGNEREDRAMGTSLGPPTARGGKGRDGGRRGGRGDVVPTVDPRRRPHHRWCRMGARRSVFWLPDRPPPAFPALGRVLRL